MLRMAVKCLLKVIRISETETQAGTQIEVDWKRDRAITTGRKKEEGRERQLRVSLKSIRITERQTKRERHRQIDRGRLGANEKQIEIKRKEGGARGSYMAP